MSLLVNFLFHVFFFAAAMRLKGGGHAQIRRWAAKKLGIKFDEKHNVIGEPNFWQAGYLAVTDGSILSAFAVGFMAWHDFGFWVGLFFGAAWFLGNAPSMGEIAGAIGGYKGNWRAEGRAWGWKQGAQRGIFTGSLLALATGNLLFIVAGAAFPLAYYIGVSIQQLISGKVASSWKYGEWFWGGVFGSVY